MQVSLEAFTPIIPLDADASGLPVAILRYLVTNPASQAAEISIAFSLDNLGVGVRGEQRPAASPTNGLASIGSPAILQGF